MPPTSGRALLSAQTDTPTMAKPLTKTERTIIREARDAAAECDRHAALLNRCGGAGPYALDCLARESARLHARVAELLDELEEQGPALASPA